MTKGKGTKRFSAAELGKRQERGESRTDLAPVGAKTEEELERDITSDPDWKDVSRDWYKGAEAVMPTRE
jgi:hypothetical protein